MKDRQRSIWPAGFTPAGHLAVQLYGLMKGAGTRIKEGTLRLLPGLPRPLSTVRRANRAAASDFSGFPGFSGMNGGWARTEYGDYYATSVAGAETSGTK